MARKILKISKLNTEWTSFAILGAVSLSFWMTFSL